METFRFAILSDVHRGAPGQQAHWADFEDKFFIDFDAHLKRGPFDAVFFLGDLTNSGSRFQFDLLDEFLRKVWRRFSNTQAVPPFLLTVPGNHDLIRPNFSASDPRTVQLEILKALPQMPNINDLFWNQDDCESRSIVNDAFSGYTQWDESIDYAPRPRRTKGKLPGDFSVTLEKNGARLGVVGLNTAFLQLDGADYKGRLMVGPIQFDAACNGNGPEWVREHHASLLLTHHPPEWLEPHSRNALTGEILHNRFAAHLFGHEHEALTRVEWRGSGQPWRFIQASSLYGRRTYADGTSREGERNFGYATGELTMNGDKGKLRLRRSTVQVPRTDNGGTWEFKSDIQAGTVDNQGMTSPLEIKLLKPLVKPLVKPLPRLPKQQRGNSVAPPPIQISQPQLRAEQLLADIHLSHSALIQIKGVLESVVDAVLYANSDKQPRLRVFCHLAAAQHRLLVPVASRSEGFADDFQALIPYEGIAAQPFVIAGAYSSRSILGENLESDRPSLYSADLRHKIRPDLKSVFAVPLRKFEGLDGPPLGTLSIDSTSHTLEQLRLTSEAARCLGRSFAVSLFNVVMHARGEAKRDWE